MLEIFIKSHQISNQFDLSQIKFKVKSGEIFALIGKSGSGKSSIANIMVGNQTIANSSIQINSIELNDGIDRLIKQFPEMGYVPQNLHLKPNHTVENFIEMLYQRLNEKDLKERKNVLLKKYHLEKVLKSKIVHLSGGERQKLALIQAFSLPIEALILDEPFSQLDTEQKLEFSSIVKNEVIENNIPCVLISHDITDILKLSDQVGLIENGKIVFQGNWKKFASSKNKLVLRLKNAMIEWKSQTDMLIQNLNIL
jgi:ABC-type multidrug transport system ATPase subunit